MRNQTNRILNRIIHEYNVEPISSTHRFKSIKQAQDMKSV